MTYKIMIEKPILFNSEMVRAVLDGRKTMTRRVIDWKRLHKQAGLPFPTKCKLAWYRILDSWGLGTEDNYIGEVKCPYGKKGDRLWVCESMRKSEAGRQDNIYYSADNKGVGNVVWGKIVDYGWEDKSSVPSIHMPRWASRINLEIVGVRVERVASISPSDCSKEGVTFRKPEGCWTNTQYNENAVIDFKTLWDSINANRKDKDGNLLNYSWADNPWVFVVEFKRIA